RTRAAGAPSAKLSLALPPPSMPATGLNRVIGIGASAGGPSAVVSVLSPLPRDIDAAIAVVQHLPNGFVESFAQYLRDYASLQVRLVDGRAPIEPGVVFLPADDHHLVVSSSRTIVATRSAPIHGFRPSVTHLFESLAERVGAMAIGVILSGMGSDGALG